MAKVPTLSWHGCYKEGWQNAIAPEAFSHPAKAARGLARRIYAHAIERGYLGPGDTCLDPFAGIGGFALDALANGLHFVGVELEQSFVDMGAGCDCTGISKADWVACFGRWKRFAYKDGRHWCPRCLAEAERVIAPRPPTLPGMEPEPTASYERNSGKIPHTEPHYYSGNLDLFARHARGGARAVLVQGDSRRLCEVLEGARAEGIIASPPFCKTQGFHDKEFSDKWGPKQLRTAEPMGYGTDPAQLGNMPTGEPPQAVIASPPYTGDGVGHDAGHPRLDAVEDARREAKGCGRRPAYGQTNGQLAAMREGDVDAVIASPPFAHDTEPHGDLRPDDGRLTRRTAERSYGQSDGQLAALPEGEPPQAVISSPPFAASLPSGTLSEEMIADLRAKGHGPARGSTHKASYGTDPAQLGNMKEGGPPAGIVSSPPYEESMASESHGIDWSKAKKDYSGRLMHSQRMAMMKKNHDERRYGSGTENLGNQQGDTFWSAAKTIMEQCHQVLAPGGVAIFVTKRFVRDKKIVEFSQQWADLCQSCGFELIEWIKAWLVEERGTQYDLAGEAHTKTVKRFSFFRRLHARKYPHLAIEWEDVLIFRKAVLHDNRK